MKMTNKAFFCEKCSLQFDKKIVYDIHLSFVHKMNIEVKSEEKTIEIKEEDEGLVLQSEITKSKQNIANSIQRGNNSHKCTICDYSSSKKEYLKQHINSVHEGKKPNKCSICDYSCSRNTNLKQHIESVHEGTKPNK